MSEIIAEQPALEQLCADLAGVPAMGLDTEFLRERTYFAQLCLLQVSFDDAADPRGCRAYCIDPLQKLDLSPLRAALGSPTTIKIVHAARQDLEVLWPVVGPVVGLFDTQIAAGLIGLPAQVGYAGLVSRVLEQQLAKSETRTDWSRRPLSAAQIAYALDDVRYLLPLRVRLTARLQQLDRWSWFEEEMAALNDASTFAVDPEQAWRRFKGLAELDPARLEVARVLAAWRERRAIESDRPRSWILPDASLRDMVLRVPRSEAELVATPELPEGTRTRSGPQLLALIAALGLPAALPPLPAHRRPDPAVVEAVRNLSKVTQQTAQELGVVPEILATRRDMERLVAGDRDAGPLTGWRRDLIGQRLLAALG